MPGIMARTVFQYGGRQSSITFFDDAKNLPEYVLQLIWNDYHVCRITSARMIETKESSRQEVQFLIQLEDEQFVRFVRICHNRLELIKQTPKK
jgi:hypothetical protein